MALTEVFFRLPFTQYGLMVAFVAGDQSVVVVMRNPLTAE